jgi:hypothetical protein
MPGNCYPVDESSLSGRLKIATTAWLRTVYEVEQIPVSAKPHRQSMRVAQPVL